MEGVRFQTFYLQYWALSSAVICPPKTPALFRATGTISSTIEGSKSLSSPGSGTTDDYLIVKCSAYALRVPTGYQMNGKRFSSDVGGLR